MKAPAQSISLTWVPRLAGLLLSMLALSANAAVINVAPGAVNFNALDGVCSLYEAVQTIFDNTQADPNCDPPSGGFDTVSLAAGSSYTLNMDHDLNGAYIPDAGGVAYALEGNGATITLLLTAPDLPLMRIGNNVEIRNVAFSNARSAGAITIQGGTPSLTAVHFLGNEVALINTAATGLLVENSTFEGTGSETGINIMSTAPVDVVNSTFSGLDTGIDVGIGLLSLNNVTLAANGTGIRAATSTVTIANSILGNLSGINCVGGSFASAGYNIFSDASCGPGATGDAVGLDPDLNPLADNGGPTPTHLPQASSGAIDASQNLTTPCLAQDQRGISRPQDGNGDLAAECDIGAVEVFLSSADLAIDIVSSPAMASVGQMVSFTVTVENLGPAGDGNTQVEVQFPPSLINITWSCDGFIDGLCVASGVGDIDETVVLGAAQVVTFNVDAEVGPSAGGLLTATASITPGGSLPDSDPANNSDQTVLQVPILYDLQIFKSDAKTSAASGSTLTYTIRVRNLGSQAVPSATVTDVFPASLINISWTCSADPGASCPAQGSGDINANVSLNAGATLIFTAAATIDPAFSGAVNNVATVSIDAPLTDQMQNNNASADTTLAVFTDLDLFVNKSVNLSQAEAGDTLIYTVEVGNIGPASANDARVLDFVPVEVLNPDWICSADANSFCPPDGSGNIDVLVNIAAGESVVFTVTGMLGPASVGLVTNAAQVIAPAAVMESVLGNNSATVVTAVNLPVDLTISKTDGEAIVNPGTLVSYTISVSNNGSQDATGAAVQDIVPAALLNVAWSCQPGAGAACTLSGSGDINDLVNIPAGSSITYQLSGSIDESFSGSLSNTASVSGINDANPDDNVATDVTQVTAEADLVLTKTADTEELENGDEVGFSLTVSNQGPNAAESLLLEDQWFDGLILLSLDSGQFSCQSDGLTKQRCQLGRLEAGATATLDFVFEAFGNAGEMLENSASLSSDTLDPEPDNNAASDQVLIVAPLRLLPEDPILPPAEVGAFYSIKLSTEGGIDPVSLQVSELPPGLEISFGARVVLLPRLPLTGSAKPAAPAPFPPSSELIIAGTPERSGSFVFTATARDSSQPPQLIQWSYCLQIGEELIFEPEQLPVAANGQDYLAQISVINGIPPYQIAIDNAQLSGFGLSAENGIIQGNVIQTSPGTVEAFIDVTAEDAIGNTGATSYSLFLSDGSLQAGQDLPAGVVNISYGAQLQAVGGTPPYSWSGGNGLPAGLNLAGSGFVSGAPQAGGDFSFSAMVSDADGSQITVQYDLQILADGLLQLESRLPRGIVGRPYATPTAISGGAPPYDCLLLQGRLPPGLTLNGCNEGISGIPTEAGSYEFQLTLEDSADPAAMAAFPGRIQIAEATTFRNDDDPPDLRSITPARVPVADSANGAPGADFIDESLQQMAVDGFGSRYLIGYSWNGQNYDLRVLKYDVRGGLVWDQRYDSGDHDYGYAASISPADQALYVGGYSLRNNQYLASLLRYDLAGNLQQVVMDGDDSQVKAYYALQADQTGVYAIGERYNGDHFDGLITRYDHNGVRQWQALRQAGMTATAYTGVLTDCTASGCDLVLAGSEGEDNPAGWVSAVDRSGGAVQSVASLSAAVFALQQLVNGDLIAGASANSDDWQLTRMTAAGAALWSTTITEGQRLRGLAIDRGGFAIAAGTASGGDGLLAVLSPDGDVLDLFPFDQGLREAFHAGLTGPEGLLTVAGEQEDANGTRFLLININTGKAFQ